MPSNKLYRISFLSTILIVISCFSTILGSTDPNTLLKQWNAIITNDFTSVSEIEGRTFIAGNYNASNSHQYGFKLTSNSSSDVVFAVGGSVNATQLAGIKVFYGSAAVSSAVSTPGVFQFMNGGTLSASSSWPAANSPVQDIINAANYWKTLTPNGTVQLPGSQPAPLKFICPTGQKLAVFNVTDTQSLENSNAQQIEVTPADSTQTIIINVNSVDGNVNWSNSNLVGNFDNEYWRSRIIWNIYTDANNGNMGTISCGPNMKGSLISPTATLSGNSNFDGNVVCKNLQINSEIHLASSTGWNGNAPSAVQNNASLGDKVWLDANKNGIQDAGEAGIANVTVKLYDASNTLVGTTTTDASGIYGFSGLAAGTYTVQFVAPSGYTISSKDQGSDDNKDSDADATTGKTASVTLIAGQSNLTVDAGMYVTPASLGDKVWLDANKDGIQDAGEVGLANVTVKLFDASSALVGTTTTNASGIYGFSNLAPGTYTVQFVAPSGYTISPKDSGTDNSKDSDADASTGKTASVTLLAGDNNLTVDAGMYVTPASLGDKVWLDANKNGIQDAGEAGIANVTVKLYDATNTLVGTTTTDASGIYGFSNLAPGTYSVQFVAPAGYTISPKDQGNDDSKDSDADVTTGKTASVTLTAGQSNLTIDAGMYVTPASLGDKVWLDVNKNGIQDAGEVGISNVTVKLYDATNTLVGTTTTDANGIYGFSNLAPGTYTVQFVAPAGYTISPKDQGTDDSKDSDADATTGKTDSVTLAAGDNNLTVDAGMYVTPASLGDKVWLDANKNGIQDAGEVGIANVTVKLYDATNTLVGTTTTDASGIYGFSNLAPGTYSVQFVAPAGYTISPKDQGSDDSKDSDADATTGKTTSVTLTAGQSNLTIDAGMYVTPIAPASLGDKVWLDANKDGIQDVGEVGIANVTVKLYDATNTLVGTTTTDASGIYGFSNLAPGTYTVQFVAPAGYTISSKDQGSDDSKDSDADATTGKTASVTLAAGDNNLTIDAGMYVTPASLGDKVWLDANKDGIQDAGEVGLANVTVNLYDASNTIVGTTTTNSNGIYGFSNLAPGTYTVQFVAPTGYTISPKDQGSDDSKDSDADATTGKTASVTLAAGQANLTIDAGMYYNNAADLKIEKTVSDSVLSCGKNLTYTIKLTNNGPINAGSIIVADILPAGLSFVSASATKGSYDAATGKWTVGSMANGAYATLTIQVKVDCSAMNNANIDLGPVKDFNVFVIEDITQPSADTQGKLAVGRNATLGCYSVGDQLPVSNGTTDVLVVGNNLTYTTGAVYGGNAVYGGTSNLPKSSVSFSDGSVRKDSVIDFTAAKSYLENLSTQLGAYAVNGVTTFEWGAVKMVSTSPYINVFNVNGNDLNSANNVQIDVPNGSVVIVNVTGTSINWHGGLVVNGTAINNVIYNFPQATSLAISGINVTGSVLAPFASLNFPAGIITGQTMVKSMSGSGQFNIAPFLGNIPANKSIVNVASIVSSDITDINSSNDVASASAAFPQDPSSSSSGSGSTNNWQLVGNLPSGATVTCIKADQSGNIYAGTVWGYIYKSSDNGTTWSHVNPDMYSGPIWAIAIHSNGSVFAATVTGVYKSSDNCATWGTTDLQNLDVRALKIDASGVIYAGTWNNGVFVSNDNGASFASANNGLGSHNVVTSLAVTPNQNVFVGTFDGGVTKSTDKGSSWVSLNVGYNYIWTLATNSKGDLFAGTYGDGIYRSTDNGSSWNKIPFPGTYAYELVIDASNNIFASSYSGGVYVSTNNGNTWTNIGMGGMSLSSMMIVPDGKIMYTGTAAGKIFMKKSNLTAVSGTENSKPTEFSLNQNYPNPFNPSTVISYAVPYESKIILKVYNITGQEVFELVNGTMASGNYQVSMNASNLPSGMYIYRMNAVSSDGKHQFSTTKKMMLIK